MTEAGERNVQVPSRAVVLSAAWRPAEKWTLSGDTKFVFDTVDKVDTISVELDDYVLVDAKLAYRHNDNTARLPL